jgi:Carboxypeptidase regulatory-like domain
MNERIDDRISSWVREVLPGVAVTVGAPTADGREKRGVSLYLWQLRPKPPLGSLRHDVLQVSLEYLVRTWAPDPADAHEMLLDLAFSAMQEPGFELDLEPLDPSVWVALGIPPEPSIRLTVPSQRTIGARRARPVLHPLGLTSTSLSSLSGLVRSPDGIPIPGARVEIPAISRRSRTDADGRFRLDAIPTGTTPLRVRVTAKGREAWMTVGAADDRAAVVIEIDPREESDAGIPHS